MHVRVSVYKITPSHRYVINNHPPYTTLLIPVSV